jgi:hypothetical protein
MEYIFLEKMVGVRRNPMTDQDKHKFIVEKLGGCWHEIKYIRQSIGDVYTCSCLSDQRDYRWLNKNSEDKHKNLNLDTPDGFFWLWGKMREDENKWNRFCNWLYENRILNNLNLYSMYNLIDNPSRFIDVVGEFLKEEKG